MAPDLRVVSLFLTARCSCRFCRIWGDAGWARRNPSAAAGEIDFTALAGFRKEVARESGPVTVRQTGGEPSLYSRFADVLKLLRSFHYNIQVLTNGHSLIKNHDVLTAYADVMKDAFGYHACHALWHDLRVRPDGNVFLCPDLAECPIGNIAVETCGEIWQGARADSFRSFTAQGLHGLCNRCCRLFKNYDAVRAAASRKQTLRRHFDS